MTNQKLLTRAEFQVMRILWNLPGDGGFTSDILERYESPKPAYTTLATFLKILKNKGFVSCQKESSKLYYKPIVPLEEYARTYLGLAKDTFFHGSFIDMLDFFLENESLTPDETERAINLIRDKQQK